MVTTFLFFSGYGIYESVKKNEKYFNNFFRNRFIPTFLNFEIAILLFIILNFFMNDIYSTKQMLLSLIGWESIGNSNWYMFAIFVEYIFTWISFKIFKDKGKAIICLTILSILYMACISVFKDSYWYNTILCYPFGFIYSYYKSKIDNIVFKNNKEYIKCSILLFIFFILWFVLYKIVKILYIYNIISIIFVCMLLFLSMKIEYKSRIFKYLGERVFWIYILQRIPMILLQGKINNNYIYLFCVVIITLFMTELLHNLTKKLWKTLKKY